MAMPKWLDARLQRMADELEEIDRILHLSMDGLSELARIGSLLGALAHGHNGSPNATKHLTPQQTEALTVRAKFAEAEIAMGFPAHHAQSVISLWSTLEAGIEDIVTLALVNEKERLRAPAIQRLKISLAEYESLSEEERMRFLVKELARHTNSDLKQGVARFEVLLEPVGLSGEVPDLTRKALFELSQVRNVLVHRSGVADKAFCEACPWLSLSPGQKFQVDHRGYRRYRTGIHNYYVELLKRELIRSGGNSPEEAEKTMAPYRWPVEN